MDTVFAIILGVVSVVFLVVYDRVRYKKLVVNELDEMISSGSVGKQAAALAEYRRRGLKYQHHLPALLTALLRNSSAERGAVRNVVLKFFPETKHVLSGMNCFRSAETIYEENRTFFEAHGVKAPGSAA